MAIIGGGFLVYWLFTSASRHVTNNLSLVKASLQVGAIELQGIPLKIALHIGNNTQFALPLDAFKGFLSDGRHDLAPVNINHSVIIEPNQTSIITIDSFLDFIKVGAAIIDRFKSGDYLRGLRIKGWMTIKGIDIPIDKDINPFNA